MLRILGLLLLTLLTVEASEKLKKDDESFGEHNDHTKGALNLWLVSLGLTAVVLSVYAVHKLHSEYVSESGVIIIVGAVLGGIVALIDYARGAEDNYIDAVKFDQGIFINFILPIIIFEAGYSMKHGGVLRSLGAVLLLAIFGTLLSSLIIGMTVYGISSFSAPEIYNASGAVFICLSFGALLSATDPVAVIAVLSSKFNMTKEPPLLYNIIFGESVLNDAVAIVLFQVFIGYVDVEMTAGNVVLAVLKFLYIFILSGLVGYAYGLLCSVFTRFVDLRDHPHFEIVTAMLFALGSYYLCEFIHLSGIMGLFVTARIIGHHASYNMSEEARKTAPMVFKTLASLAESGIFFLLGTAIWSYPHSWNAGFSAMVVIICLIARACVVFPMCGLANITRKREKISGKMQLFTWYSGLRGAIAFGLAVILDGSKAARNITGGSGSSVLLSTTLVVILFTVLLMGSFISKLLKVLELDTAPPREELPKTPGTEATHGPLKNLGKWLRHSERRFIHPLVRRPECQSPLSPSYQSYSEMGKKSSSMPVDNDLTEPLTIGTQTPQSPVIREEEVNVEMAQEIESTV